MKLFFLAISLFILNSSTYSQLNCLDNTIAPKALSEEEDEEDDDNIDFSYPKAFHKRFGWNSSGLYSLGLSAGPETLFAVKGTIQGRYAYGREMRNWDGEFTAFGIHGGIELSLFGMFAVWGSAGINAGFSIGPVTIDGSLTFLGDCIE